MRFGPLFVLLTALLCLMFLFAGSCGTSARGNGSGASNSGPGSGNPGGGSGGTGSGGSGGSGSGGSGSGGSGSGGSGSGGPATQAQLATDVVAQNLQEPWSLAFAPDGRLFFTEAPGRLRAIRNGTLLAQPVISIATAGFEGGLTGMDIDRDFSSNGFIYAHYCTTDLKCHVVRIVVSGDTGTIDRTLLDYPVAQFDHTGGRLKVGPDNLLYLSVGDHDLQSSAQNPASWDGKILRMNLDGTPAAGNPFPQNPYVYSYGHRDPQGLAWDSSGTLYETEHGPVANDEVNIIIAGGNYGWPNCTGSCNNASYIDPIVNLAPNQPAMPPSGAAFYAGGTIPGWNGSLLIAVLGLDNNPQAHQVRQLIFNAPGGKDVTFQQALFMNQFGRIRDVVEGPDGFVYFSTSNYKQGSKAAPNDDRIVRVRPM